MTFCAVRYPHDRIAMRVQRSYDSSDVFCTRYTHGHYIIYTHVYVHTHTRMRSQTNDPNVIFKGGLTR